MRIVSHTCSNTEIVCALGLSECLVGVDDHSDFPPEVVAGLPRIGPDLNIDVDRVVALKPDLVITSLTVPGHEKCLERLEARGLPLLVTRPQSTNDVLADIIRIADALSVTQRGEALVAKLKAELSPMAVSSPRPKILIEWWPKPVIVPGKLSWANDLIVLAGGENPMADREVESAPVTDDDVIEWSPDAVVIAWCGVPFDKYRKDVVRRRPGWGSLPAIANDQIHAITEAWLGRPGPRLGKGLTALRVIVEAVNRSRGNCD